ncbi:hypothetical protein [Maribacter sp. 2-571]|uniref:hypothetical protein n=1 Tax=Maribacter sp. 2-571 TaxID=3417569 RepID=UPI003D328858
MNTLWTAPRALDDASLLILGTLVLFQLTHYTVASWKFFKNSKGRFLKTASVTLFWIVYGVVFVSSVTAIPSYVNAVPYVLCGLYLPSVIAIVLLLVSQKFRTFTERMSLRWMIQSVAGPARMIVGMLFLVWFFAERLPGVVAWIAGPGDWISGFIAFFAVGYLTIFQKTAGLSDKHWSLTSFRKATAEKPFSRNKKILVRNLHIAIILVGFGILDFILAPASTAVSIALGEIPEAMGKLPLTLIPLVLVPQVLVLEVLAMHQLIGLKRMLRNDVSKKNTI